ncbi:response regulator transcription factor [Streptomyces goshikiensis]|uniref:response regulator transcription factor n=1 Tax=Streptomyces goshikiensis TaxID=1942 RepID=UPI00365AE20F
MTSQLNGVRILVADDQSDVARTLCRPLSKSGARLRFVTDGETALAEVNTRPYDLLLIDMKMPPYEWGGLWLLQELQKGGWRMPSLVLSGEGSKQQVIEALRMGASDWVVKDDAGEELLERCVKVLSDRMNHSLEFAGTSLPTPLARRFARYSRTIDREKRISEGLHALEAIFRFAAILGLSSTTPAPLRGIRPDQFAAPSMGTWFSLCTALGTLPDAGDDFVRMLSWLVPERSDHQLVQELISARNDLAHGRGAPTSTQAEQLDGLLRRFAHRASSSWRADLTVPTTMTYDGTVYVADVLSLRGVDRPVPKKVEIQAPVITGQAFLVPRDAAPVPLAPWFLTQMDETSNSVRCFQFDGMHRDKDGLVPAAPFKYAKTDEGAEVATVSHPDATWQTLTAWVAN